jgi:hypothetical protein
MSTDTHIFEGFWINHSHGYIKGATLTVSQKSGGLLASFLAIYITFAGGMLWMILRFVLHQANAPPEDSNDGLVRQRQVILRNNGHGAACYALFILPFRWKQSPGRFLHCVPYALIALLCIVGFGIAGVFSSTISKSAGNSALLVGSLCGVIGPSEGDDKTVAKFLADTYEAANYARQCYGDNPSLSSSLCQTYVRPSLPFTTNANAACPFGPDHCITPAFEMDTGRLDSHFDLGINSPPKERVQFRRVTTCAPLKKLPSTVVNDSIVGPTLFINTGRASSARLENNINSTFSYITRAQSDQVGPTLLFVIVLSQVQLRNS